MQLMRSRTKSLVATLLASLFILTAIYIFLRFQSTEPDSVVETPRGERPVIPRPLMVESVTPAPEPSEFTPEVGEGRISPRRGRRPPELVFDTLVLFEGRPVSGARAAAAPVSLDDDGLKIAETLLGSLSDATGHVLTGDDGKVEVRPIEVHAGSGTGTDRIEVLAFHPLYGSAYRGATVDELRDGEPLELELFKRRSVIGRVVTADGAPIVGARVEIGVGWERELACCEGLGTLTREDGTFAIIGVMEKNIPYVLHASYHSADTQC